RYLRHASVTITSPFSLPPHPSSPLFPYTTLFRSAHPRAEPAGDCRPRIVLVASYPPVLRGRYELRRGNSPFRTLPLLGARRRTRSEEHTSDSSHDQISYAVFCLKKKKISTY